MKLYSRTQLFRTTLICVVAAVLLTAALCVNITKKKTAERIAEKSELAEALDDGKTETATIASSIEDSVAFLEQNPASVI